MKKLFSSILLAIILLTSSLAVNAETVVFNTKTKNIIQLHASGPKNVL